MKIKKLKNMFNMCQLREIFYGKENRLSEKVEHNVLQKEQLFNYLNEIFCIVEARDGSNNRYIYCPNGMFYEEGSLFIVYGNKECAKLFKKKITIDKFVTWYVSTCYF